MHPRRPSLWLALSILVPAIVLLLNVSLASDKGPRFFVSAPHTKEECVKTLDEAKAVSPGFLNKCDWGCMAGDHTCYLVLEGKDEAAVLNMLPASMKNAKIVRLNKFTAEQIATFHKKM